MGLCCTALIATAALSHQAWLPGSVVSCTPTELQIETNWFGPSVIVKVPVRFPAEVRDCTRVCVVCVERWPRRGG